MAYTAMSAYHTRFQGVFADEEALVAEAVAQVRSILLLGDAHAVASDNIRNGGHQVPLVPEGSLPLRPGGLP